MPENAIGSNTADKPMKKKFGKVDHPELTPLWLGLFVDVLGFSIVIPFLPALIKIYHTTPVVIGLLLATNAIFTIIFAPIWGRISDHIGRKPVLILAQSGTFLAFTMLGLSNSLQMMFFARALDGIFGGYWPVAKAMISDATEHDQRGRGVQMSNIGVVHTLASLVGPGVGGFLSIVYILGPSFPLASASFAAAGLSLLSVFITVIYVNETWSKEKRASFHKEEKIKSNIRKNKDALYLLSQYTLHTFAFTMYITTLTIYIGLIFHLDTLGISILLTISGVSRAIIRFTLFKPTLKLLGQKRMTQLGLFIIFITFFLIGFIQDMVGFIILMIVISYGVSCSRGLLTSKVTLSVSPKEMGKVNGYMTTLDGIAQIIGPILGTLILSLLNAYWFGVYMSLFALGAFLMAFKKITPFNIKMKKSTDIALNH